MKVSKKPSPGPSARPLPEGEVTGTDAGVPDAETTTKLVLLWLVVGLINCASIGLAADTRTRPNVLFLAIDDLNDWVGCLGGHPQAKTPNIDKLAEKGVLFEQAYCAAPLCNPSRTSVMTGLRPSTTGIYGNLNWFRDLPK
ncbi:MAG: sulfatase-like hydrolase/transferase, partial [Planctomycetes bacterium]|nr:sulfatase-like hydrolase/transferase [Planctomycetota bacterium]